MRLRHQELLAAPRCGNMKRNFAFRREIHMRLKAIFIFFSCVLAAGGVPQTQPA